MNQTESSFASLGPTLLARKGGARPAMRPQLHPLPDAGEKASNLEDLGWNDMGESDHDSEADILPLTPAPANPDAEAEARQDDEEAREQLAAVIEAKPSVVLQQEAIQAKLMSAVPSLATVRPTEKTAPEPLVMQKPKKQHAPSRPRKGALEQGRRAAFTLRLDAERHLKLRLASTVRNRSAQQLVTEALDRLLKDIPEIEALAAQVKRREA